MPIGPPITEPVLKYSALDIITDALIEVDIGSPGEVPDPDTAQWAFRKYNYMLDSWATSKRFVFASTFNTYTLVPGLQPALIGPAPGATYVVTQRPVKILAANVIINNVSPPIETLIPIEDDQWWMGVTLKGIQSMYPTNLFYNPAFPNGELYFWPVPTTAFGVRLQTWGLINQFSSITDSLGGPGGPGTLAPGYRNAMMLSLAETLGGEPRATLARDAATARAAIFGNNSPSANISTLDSGMPGNQEGRRSTTFSYRTRTWT